MFNVLLVDDERMLLEGISAIVDWKKSGTVLQGTARNGLEALEFIGEHDPDIVITDITMPGLDGMGLIERASVTSPTIKWILLSGYNEFEYAQKAMRFGVKHYLLKPTSEEAIQEALDDAVQELVETRKNHLYVKTIENKMHAALMEDRELIFKEALTNSSLPEEKRRLFLQSTFGSDQAALLPHVVLAVIYMEGITVMEEIYEIRETTAAYFSDRMVCSAILAEKICIMVKADRSQDRELSRLREIQTVIKEAHGKIATLAVSNHFPPAEIHARCQKILAVLEERFYLGPGSLITESEHFPAKQSENMFSAYDLERCMIQLNAGKKTEALKELHQSLDRLREKRLRPTVAKAYLIQFYLAILNITSPSFMKEQIKEIDKLESIDTLSDFRSLLAEAITASPLKKNAINEKNYSAVVNKMMEIIKKNLENPDLSLQWVASEVLYMNTDYLGKLFKKEVGEKFSAYVMRRKMDRAVEIIAKQKDIKVFEVAEKLGYGNNPQYFSHIFKKRTGCTPTDWIKNR